MTTLDFEGVREKIRRNMPAHLRTQVEPLTWSYIGDRDSESESAYIESRCGRYTVTRKKCQVSEGNDERAWFYFAWRVPPARMKDGLSVMATPLGSRLPDIKSAQEKCDEDWRVNGVAELSAAAAV